MTTTAFNDHGRFQWAGRATAYQDSLAALCAHPAGFLLDAAEVSAGTRLLDVGTGTGTVAALACSRAAHERPLADAVPVAPGRRIGPQDGEGSRPGRDREMDRLSSRWAINSRRIPSGTETGRGARPIQPVPRVPRTGRCAEPGHNRGQGKARSSVAACPRSVLVETSPMPISLTEHRVMFGVGQEFPDLLCTATRAGNLGSPGERLLA